MLGWNNIEQLWRNLLGLGARRLAALGVVGFSIALLVGLGSYLVSRPDFETVYVGLNPQDVSRMASVLHDAGLTFDVGSDGTSVMVRRGQSSQARSLLAEKGLPSSPTAGYELFDKLGPLGLTSFMQEVTRVRALEGEIARTVQSMRGVKAARVHIVLPDPGSFRRNAQPPSASVVIRTENAGDASAVPAIRHLVAAAIPGLTLENVRVLSTDGAVLAAGGEEGLAAPTKMVELERSVSKELQNNIRRTLVPHLGLDNFEVSVAVRLNVDKRQVNETSFDPESKVERSVRVVKESGNSHNPGSRANVTVEQNVPAEQTGTTSGGATSKKSNQRRDELTNYEISSRSMATTSEGYKVENVTVAVVVNRKQLAAMAGDQATPEAIAARIAEFEKIVGAAAGIDAKRGDRVTIAALDFAQGSRTLESLSSPGIVDTLMGQTGTIFNGLAIVAATILLVWLGLKPAINAILTASPPSPVLAAPADLSRVEFEGVTAKTAAIGEQGFSQPQVASQPSGELDAEFLSNFAKGKDGTPKRRLEQMVQLDQEQAVAVLKRWVREGSPT